MKDNVISDYLSCIPIDVFNAPLFSPLVVASGLYCYLQGHPSLWWCQDCTAIYRDILRSGGVRIVLLSTGTSFALVVSSPRQPIGEVWASSFELLPIGLRPVGCSENTEDHFIVNNFYQII